MIVNNWKYWIMKKLKILLSHIMYSPCNLEKTIITTKKSRKQMAPSFRISIRERRMSSISGHRETPPPTLSRSMLCFVSRCLLIKVCLSLFTRPFQNEYELLYSIKHSLYKWFYIVFKICFVLLINFTLQSIFNGN